MRTLWFILAAIFSLAALFGNWFQLPGWVPLVSLAIAGAFLVLGFFEASRDARALRAKGDQVALSEEQRETIRRMVGEGNRPLAIRQVQMWFRNVSAEDAARIVREL
ncbi:hypothetical protein [Corynebacterium liangguodongii]|uniref:Uncharacterized protein n=1 Tax=Corynebacterium liangguodongii TaxID=2079535 RepID=A0A2S0WFF8_9CORY|nr:hypothetical protein [Corynebacterium liangguodongii]AWB84515.1 hypothetical protein C3E79_08480 [Corynebacterium liangguodongii]PWB98733.1 hypothetical protein DF219_10555 [Corynebacterium liangguodongii]